MDAGSYEPPYGRIFLAGAGRVGTAVALLLQRAGSQIVGVASRSESSSRRAGDLLGAPIFDLCSGPLPEADVWLIGASEGAIEAVAGFLAGRAKGGAAVHLAGAQGTSPLAPLISTGCGAAALHPVQACPDIAAAVQRLPGSAWGMTVTADLGSWATELVAGPLQGTPHFVREEDRPVWHAASVITSNGIAALLALGESLLASIGATSPIEILGPLASGTVLNARGGGGGAPTLTGPVVRGERDSVARHLDALGGRDPALAADYARVGSLILAAARRAGRVDDAQEKAIEEILQSWK